MKLKAYLAQVGIKLKDFAPIVGISLKTLYGITSGAAAPGIHLCRRIEIHTEGKVTAKDFGIIEGKTKKRVPKPIVKQLDMKDF